MAHFFPEWQGLQCWMGWVLIIEMKGELGFLHLLGLDSPWPPALGRVKLDQNVSSPLQLGNMWLTQSPDTLEAVRMWTFLCLVFYVQTDPSAKKAAVILTICQCHLQTGPYPWLHLKLPHLNTAAQTEEDPECGFDFNSLPCRWTQELKLTKRFQRHCH